MRHMVEEFIYQLNNTLQVRILNKITVSYTVHNYIQYTNINVCVFFYFTFNVHLDL